MATFGPFLKTQDLLVGNYGHRLHWKYQEWYIQKPITARPLPYVMYDCWSNGGTDAASWSYSPSHHWDPTFRGQVAKQAYDRLKDAIAEPASLAVSIAERKQAFSMIESRCIQLYRFTRNLRRLRFGDAARDLGLSGPPKGVRRHGRDLGGAWLEYHLGWKPLIGDIHSGLDVLQRGLPPFRVRGRARGQKYKLIQDTWDLYYYQEQDLRVQYLASVTVSDPNLWRANQLGLINPAVVLWELVPFSFVVDWFLPVGDFLSQYTDFVGLTLSDSSTTYYSKHTDHALWKDGRILPDQKKWAINVARVLGINSPPLVVNRVTGLSPTRAATAVSLLLQQLRGK